MKRKHIIAHMEAAFVYAKLSYCKRRQVGCLMVKNGNIISHGYNGTPSGEENNCEGEDGHTKDNVIHAEDNALRKLTKSTESADGADVFLTTAPCVRCAERLVDAEVSNVYYVDVYRNDDGLKYLRKHAVFVEQITLNELIYYNNKKNGGT